MDLSDPKTKEVYVGLKRITEGRKLKNRILWWLEDHPAIIVTSLIILAFAFFWWMNRPIEVIYDPSAPPYPQDIQDAQGW